MSIKLSDKSEGMLAVLAALVVLFTSLLDPLVSAGIAVTALALLGVYHFVKN